MMPGSDPYTPNEGVETDVCCADSHLGLHGEALAAVPEEALSGGLQRTARSPYLRPHAGDLTHVAVPLQGRPSIFSARTLP